MPVSDIFSKRQRRQSGQGQDVFVYDEIPEPLRAQVVHILRDLMGTESIAHNDYQGQYRLVNQRLAREYGMMSLGKGQTSSDILFNFILKGAAPEQVLDAIEMCVAVASKFDIYNYKSARCIINASQAIHELNFRFMEAGFGYQYESGQVVRVDSKFVHAEIMKPALLLLMDARFSGADEEFRNAHEHYRHGSYKECMTECLKAFESTMKAICETRKWPFQKTDTAKTLIDVCAKNGLLDAILLSHVGALRTVLEAGVPTLRNKLSGHGQGAAPVSLPAHYAAYALHLTASNIVFLVESEKALG